MANYTQRKTLGRARFRFYESAGNQFLNHWLNHIFSEHFVYFQRGIAVQSSSIWGWALLFSA